MKNTETIQKMVSDVAFSWSFLNQHAIVEQLTVLSSWNEGLDSCFKSL